MKRSCPVLSIGMPLYNEERWLSSCLESLLGQTFGDYEIIVGDNASTDATTDVCTRYATGDPRIRLLRSDANRGAVWNSQRVLEEARGEFFMFAGGHDLWHPTYLERCLEPLRAGTNVVLSHSLTAEIDEEDRVRGIMPGWLDTRGVGQMFRFNMVQWGLINGNMICGVLRREALAKTGGCRNSLGAHLIFLMELALLGEFAIVPEPLFSRREFRGEEDLSAKFRRWQQMMDPSKSNRSLTFSLAHFALEHLLVVFRARVSIWPRLLLLPSVLLILVAKLGKYVQWAGRVPPAPLIPESFVDRGRAGAPWNRPPGKGSETV